MSNQSVELLWREFVGGAEHSPIYQSIARVVERNLRVPLSLVTIPCGDRAVTHTNSEGPVAVVPLNETVCERCYTSEKILSVADVRLDPELGRRARAIELSVRGYLGMPVRFRDQVRGVLCAIDTEPRAWTESEVAQLQDLTTLLVTEFENSLLRAEIAQRQQLQDSILESIQDGISVVDVDGRIIIQSSVHEAVLSKRKTIFDDFPANLFVITREGVAVTPATSPIARAFREQTAVQEDLSFKIGEWAEPRWVQVQAQPLKSPGGQFLGAISVMRDITASVQREEALRTLASVDSLTGLHNRSALYTLGQQIMAHCDRNQTPAHLFLFDLDGLKQVNDVQGHAKGDEYIRAFAEVLRATFRSSDVVARLGGDEFVALMVGDPDVALQRLQQKIEEWNTRSQQDKLQLRCSQGLATYSPGSGLGLELLLQEADEKMYKDKSERRQGTTPYR